MTTATSSSSTVTSKSEQIKGILNRYRSISSDIFGASVITIEGFMVSSVALSEIDDGLVGGMTAALLGVGDRISKEMMSSQMHQVFVKSANGYVICNNITPDAVLLTLVNAEAKLGLIFLEIRRILPQLAAIL
ncbi:MAG: hypothetical protein GF344_18830 [Chitinivibrionales bacterium]|nr:hypothetical protein [Chitinivibrionales bacterium]